MKTLAITNELTLGAVPPVETVEPVAEPRPAPKPRPRLEVLLSPEAEHRGGTHRTAEHRLAPSRGATGRAAMSLEPAMVGPVGAVHRAEHLEVLARALESVGRGSRIELLPVGTRRFHPIAARVQTATVAAEPGAERTPEPASGKSSLIGWMRRSIGSLRGARDGRPSPESGQGLEAHRTHDPSHRPGPRAQGEGDAGGSGTPWSDWSRTSRREGGYSFYVAFSLLWIVCHLAVTNCAAADRGAPKTGDHRLAGDPGIVPALAPEGRDSAETAPAPSVIADLAGDSLAITFKITTGNNVGLTLFNDGFFGNNFANRQPSFEYPLGSNIDHMVRGGIWIGALTAEGDTLVSTATKDGSIGSRALDSEFLPAQSGISELSILPNSRYFSREARSEQDFRTSYTDAQPRTIGDEDHVPLNVKVNLETLLFSFEPFDAIVIANMNIVNTHPTDALFNVYLGFYSELATGYKDPALTDPFRGWFRQKDIAYVDSLRMVSEHHYNLDSGQAPSWAGIVLLGTRPVPVSKQQVSFNWWNWNTEEGPVNDAQRYAMMANGSIDATGALEAPNNDPVQLLSVGPIPILEAGDTLTVSWAFVGGDPDRRTGRTAEQDLAFNAGWAQTAFDLNFNIPVPPPSPDLKVIPGHGKVTLRWKDDPERFIDPKSRQMDFEGYRVYISEDRLESEFRRVREVDLVDSVFYNTGLEALVDPITIDGESYKYRYDIGGLKDGFKYWVSVTAFDTGTQEIESLESGLAQNRTFVIPGTPAAGQGGESTVKVFPNPYRGDAAWDGSLRRDRYLWFVNLPPRCTIRIYTLAGDLVDTIPFDQSTYRATEIRGIYDPTDVRNPEGDVPTLSGGMAAWDLVTRSDQGVASGLYLFAVEDAATGKTQHGKFLILK